MLRVLLISILMLLYSSVYSQLPQHGQGKNNPTQTFDLRLLNHYSLNELQNIQNTDSVKFETINYYYTQSYKIQAVNCNGCSTPTDVNSFDITPYEQFRKMDEDVTLNYNKLGFIITIYPYNSLTYLTPIQLKKLGKE